MPFSVPSVIGVMTQPSFSGLLPFSVAFLALELVSVPGLQHCLGFAIHMAICLVCVSFLWLRLECFVVFRGVCESRSPFCFFLLFSHMMSQVNAELLNWTVRRTDLIIALVSCSQVASTHVLPLSPVKVPSKQVMPNGRRFF